MIYIYIFFFFINYQKTVDKRIQEMIDVYRKKITDKQINKRPTDSPETCQTTAIPV